MGRFFYSHQHDFRLVVRELRDRLRAHVQVLDHELRWRMGDPVRQEERREVRGMAIVEAQDELAAVRRKPLRRTRLATCALTEGSMSGDGTGGIARSPLGDTRTMPPNAVAGLSLTWMT